MTRWLVGLGALAAAALGGAVGLGLGAAVLFHEADEFFRSTDGTTVYPDDVQRYYSAISTNSYVLQDATSPLAAGGILALVALLTVLAVRWERTSS
jgi:hypothetical protein